MNDYIDQNYKNLNVTTDRMVEINDSSFDQITLNVNISASMPNVAKISFNNVNNLEIYYSLNGDSPTTNSQLFKNEIIITNNDNIAKEVNIKYLIVDKFNNKHLEKSYSFILNNSNGQNNSLDKVDTRIILISVISLILVPLLIFSIVFPILKFKKRKHIKK
ncbi:UNVERIFIED_CONTAM: chitobiase/beta-hexosaminidase C-terminal domain-containing protein [Campylobacter lari]